MAGVRAILPEPLKNALDFVTSNDEEGESLVRRLLRGFSKGAGLSLLVLLLLRRSRFSRLELRRCLAMGTFTSLFRTLDQELESQERRSALARYVSDKLPALSTDRLEFLINKYRRGISGWVASVLALAVDGFSLTENSVFVTYIVTRAVWYSTTEKVNLLPEKLEFLYPVIVMCLTASQILSSYVCDAPNMDPSYHNFLKWQGQRDPRFFKYYRYPYASSNVELSHAGMGAVESLIYFFKDGLFHAARLYWPIHLFINFVSRNGSPLRFATGLTRSSVFLSAYCTIAWAVIFGYRHLFPYHTLTRFFLHVILTLPGLPILVEDKRRQALIAAYCATYALDDIYKTFLHHFGLRHTRRFGTILTVCSVGIVMQKFYLWVPHAISRNILGIPEKDLNGPQKKPASPREDSPV
mmetsp:Transcript_24268/g.67984  ORF Transcript_24268/g.67984 Transcript_24268/m.67984 type:complete len:411 (-) Transcript_24268:102-1334(-)|eukprot:CAMPEP_0119123876 /NCGR_PEP_ID=MMETSP1310-20130426/3668_1 /TAXON_ID=464262 /ORGANISM="Genus nov. species nov., Strain RCC2339" /LENGTH=410 /DNA_ID=CAMNT_0007113747 /DNA_START=108 /DNA_END=1340 /DNA_ORIENTATION=-